MGVNISGRSFLKLLDFSTTEIEYLLALSKNFKDLKRAGVPHRYLEGKNVALLFQKTSTRTRCAFEVGAHDLGMGTTYLDPSGSQMGHKESIADTARVLGRMFDGIEFRGFAQADVEELAAFAGVPVWNGLTDLWHPTQMLADVLTIQENFNYDIKGKTVVFLGDAKNNVARSLMVVCAKLGMNFVACGPESCLPARDVVEACEPIAAANGCTITLTTDPVAAVTGAHVVYTDVWVSLGEPAEIWAERIRLLEPYRVSEDLVARMDPAGIFLHCLPAFHDTKTTTGAKIAEQFGLTEMEVADSVFEGPRSRVFDEAENRMHTIKAVMYATLK
ncbi:MULTISPECIES: ornithine carbamoyltransferase [Collinsella]|uniref:ornithine carbamoyltransferase n=1 Tax=Collinsella TaxID=102106 RepID=UPI000B364DAC|nr:MULTISPECIES: ornithine carbamoyltransferase [Collinsella]MBM6941864.1 ornithine carbamoyltransferase [Collinsella intestinalis]OUO65113.1 ornithine carbamoyltransferase [Collinsella sp. An268]